MSDEEAHEAFKCIRWSDNDGTPYCPRCGGVAPFMPTRPRKLWKCKGCTHQFSVTSGTIFASRKLPVRDSICSQSPFYVNGAQGYSALQLSRDLDCQYKTAYVLSHKLRESLADQATDGANRFGRSRNRWRAYLGGYVKPANHKHNAVIAALP